MCSYRVVCKQLVTLWKAPSYLKLLEYQLVKQIGYLWWYISYFPVPARLKKVPPIIDWIYLKLEIRWCSPKLSAHWREIKLRGPLILVPYLFVGWALILDPGSDSPVVVPLAVKKMFLRQPRTSECRENSPPEKKLCHIPFISTGIGLIETRAST